MKEISINSDEEYSERSSSSPTPSSLHLSEELQAIYLQLEQMNQVYPDPSPLEEIEKGLVPLSVEDVELDAAHSVSISHNIDSLNRALDAQFKTDIFRFRGHVPMDGTVTNYTRIFEAVGDWAPNIVDARDGVRFYTIKEVYARNKYSKYPLISNGDRPPLDDEVRYRLLNGKVLDLKTRVKTHVIVKFYELDEFGGYPVIGIKSDASLQELEASCTRHEKPLDVPSLFQQAVERANASNRDLEVSMYYMVEAWELGDTPEARKLCSESWAEFSLVSPAVQKNALAQLNAWRVELTQRLEQIVQETTDMVEKAKSQELLDLWYKQCELIDKSPLTEETAESIYALIYKGLVEEPEADVEGTSVKYLQDTGYYINPVATKPRELKIEVHLDGKPYFCNTEILGDMTFSPGYVAIPEGACYITKIALCGWTSLRDGLSFRYGSYPFQGELLCPSVTPRRKSTERGSGEGPFVWKERLQVTTTYEGLIAECTPEATEVHKSYMIAYNTALLSDHVRRRAKSNALRYFRIFPEYKLPNKVICPYFSGIGLTNGKISNASLLADGLDWRDPGTFDIRLRIPPDLLSGLLLHPGKIRLMDIYEVLNGGPLYIELGDATTERRIILYDNSVKLHLEKDDPQLMASFDGVIDNQGYREVLVQEPDTGSSLSGPSAQRSERKAKSKGITQNLPTVVKQDLANLLENSKANHQPWYDEEEEITFPPKSLAFKNLKKWSQKQRPYRPGDWNGLLHYYTEKKPSAIDSFKRAYTMHWKAAHEEHRRPALQYHHPAWTKALVNVERFDDWWLDQPCRHNPDLIINDRGYPAIAPHCGGGPSRRGQSSRGRGRGGYGSRPSSWNNQERLENEDYYY